jgi:hypothetical protein
MGGVGHPQHTQTGSKSSTIAAGSNNGVTKSDAVDDDDDDDGDNDDDNFTFTCDFILITYLVCTLSTCR